MGTSYLTVIIACQTRKENHAQTLSDFDPDSYVVHPKRGASLDMMTVRAYTMEFLDDPQELYGGG